MSHNHFEFDGLADLREALRTLPQTLKAESSHIVIGAANGAAARIKGNYTRGKTGNLIAGVEVKEVSAGSVGVAAVVVSKSPHAWMYENGTQVRHTGKGAYRGVMPAAPPGRAFIPAVIKARRKMYEDLKDVLVRNGLVVVGDGG